MKKQFLLCLLMGVSLHSFSQQLLQVVLTTNGKASYRISAGNYILLMNDQGKIQTIEIEPIGEISYNKNQQAQKLGEQNLAFNYEGWLTQIGNITIQYDFNGRIDRVGDLVLRYNYNQQIAAIGSYTISYNTNNTVDQIGSSKVLYNYNGNVLKVDQSKGLIFLQLNFAK